MYTCMRGLHLRCYELLFRKRHAPLPSPRLFFSRVRRRADGWAGRRAGGRTGGRAGGRAGRRAGVRACGWWGGSAGERAVGGRAAVRAAERMPAATIVFHSTDVRRLGWHTSSGNRFGLRAKFVGSGDLAGHRTLFFIFWFSNGAKADLAVLGD